MQHICVKQSEVMRTQYSWKSICSKRQARGDNFENVVKFIILNIERNHQIGYHKPLITSELKAIRGFREHLNLVCFEEVKMSTATKSHVCTP